MERCPLGAHIVKASNARIENAVAAIENKRWWNRIILEMPQALGETFFSARRYRRNVAVRDMREPEAAPFAFMAVSGSENGRDRACNCREACPTQQASSGDSLYTHTTTQTS